MRHFNRPVQRFNIRNVALERCKQQFLVFCLGKKYIEYHFYLKRIMTKLPSTAKISRPYPHG